MANIIITGLIWLSIGSLLLLGWMIAYDKYKEEQRGEKYD